MGSRALHVIRQILFLRKAKWLKQKNRRSRFLFVNSHPGIIRAALNCVLKNKSYLKFLNNYK